MANLEEQARSIFLAALERPAEQWAAHVAEACGDHVALRQRVDQLLQAHQALGSIHGRGDDPAVTASEIPFSDHIGTVIGPYKLLECIGEGGFGVVYLAEQTQPVRRKVALKILKPGMDSRQIVARFEAERQALAIMDHPHIAKVFDGGVTDFGRSYFVMELVKGVPLTEYCDKNQLTPRERLELFITVCQAIQHAHQKGIIHRDVKPSNVLVSRHDTTPVVKVIDFGVAKAMGQELTDKTLFTGVAQMIGTPLYMSPEQAGMSDLDVDTRSDIYSLGVLLYELLTGTTPFTKEQFKAAAYDEIRRIIREVEPPTPSTRLSSSDSIGSIAAQRHMEPVKLSKLVRGELDWITMKALEKDRTRRYETANGLARDIQRYLSDEPVEACPPSAFYRLRKLGRKHRVVLSTVALIVVLLVVGVGMSLWQMFRAIDAETEAKANEATANAERDAKIKALAAETKLRATEAKARQRAFAALRSMTDVFNKRFAQTVVLTEDDKQFLRGIIQQFDAFASLQGSDAESRGVRAEGRLRVGRIQHHLGELREAEQDYSTALDIYKQLKIDFPENLEFRQKLARSYNYRGILRHDAGRLREAEADYRTAQSIQQQLVSADPNFEEYRQELAGSHHNRGVLLSEMRRYKEAEAEYAAALAIHKQLADQFPSRSDFHQNLAASHNGRGLLLRRINRLKEAAEDFAIAMGMYKQLVAEFPNHPEYRRELSTCHFNRGVMLSRTGKLKEAVQDYTAAANILRQLAAEFPARPQYLLDLASSLNNRSKPLRAMYRLREAETDLNQAVNILKQLADDFPTHIDFRHEFARSHFNRGFLFFVTGRPKEAEQDYNTSLGIYKQLVVDFTKHSKYLFEQANVHNNRGYLLSTMHRLKEAEDDYGAALSIYKQLTTNEPTRLEFLHEMAGTHSNRGNLRRGAGRLKEAEADYTAAVAILEQLAVAYPNSSDIHNALAGIYGNLGAHYEQQKNWTEAKRLLLEGRPHHLVALKTQPRNPTYRGYYRNHLSVLTRVHAGLLENDEAIRTAETRRDQGWNAPLDAYDAACCLSRCIPIVARHGKLNADQRKEAVRFYMNATLKLLRKAVRQGYRDAEHIRRESDFIPLRQLPEFQKLLTELTPTTT